MPSQAGHWNRLLGASIIHVIKGVGHVVPTLSVCNTNEVGIQSSIAQYPARFFPFISVHSLVAYPSAQRHMRVVDLLQVVVIGSERCIPLKRALYSSPRGPFPQRAVLDTFPNLGKSGSGISVLRTIDSNT
jgi:hypothetical protein